MADFRIRLTTEVEDGKSKAQLDDIISQLEKNKIKLKFDTSSFKTEMNQLQQVMNNAFKLNPKQLNNLNSIKTTLKEINKMSKDVQKTLLGGNTSSNTTNTVKNLTKEYDRCQAKIKSLQNQMSKTTNAQSYEVLEKQLDKVQKKAESTLQELNKMGKSPDLTQNLAKSFQTLQQKIESTQTKLEGFSKNKNLTSVQVKEIEKLKNTLNSLGNAKLDNIINSKESYSDMAKLETTISQVQSRLKTLTWNQQFTSQVDKAKSSVDGMIDKLSQIKGNNTYLDTSSIDNLINKIKQLNDIKIDPNSETATQQLEYLKSSINSVSSEFKQLSASSASFDKIQSQIDQLRQKCVELGTSTSQLDSFEQELREIGNLDLSRQAKELERVGISVKTFKSSLSGVKTETKATNGFFKELNSSIAAFSIGNILADGLQTGVYAIKDTIVELDSAFRDLMKVAPESFRGTQEELKSLRDKAISVGQEVARSSVDIINSTSSALQAGFKNIDGAMEYAKQVNLYANVADLSEEDADKYVKSIMSAYGGVENSIKPMRTQIQGAAKDYSLLNSYMDNANFIGNNYALTSGDIGEALSRSASTLKSYNVSLSDSMALVAGAQESIQNPEKVGNALKSLAINLGGVKTSAQDGTIELNKTAMALQKYAGISVVKKNGELMDTMEILTKLHGKWDKLTQVQKAGLGEAIAGKYHGNVFNALMDNFETVKQIQTEIANGDALGSAAKENERFVNSIEGKLISLKEEMKKLVTTTISTDMFKGMVDGATNVIKVINNVISVFDKLGLSTPLVVGTIGSLFTTIKSLGNDKSIPNFASIFLNSLDSISNGSNKSIHSLSNLSKRVDDVAKGGKKVSVGVDGVGTSLGSLGIKAGLANVAMSALNGIFLGLATFAVTKGLELVIDKINETENKAKELRSSIAETQSVIGDDRTTVKSLEKISEEYDKLANKTKKSKEELERFNELKNEIANLMPELVIGNDEDGNPILALNGSLDETINKLEEGIKLKQELLKTQENNLGTAETENIKKINLNLGKQKREIEGVLNNANNAISKSLKTGIGKDIEYRTQKLQKALENEKTMYEKEREDQLNLIEKYNEKELAIQKKNLNSLMENTNYQKLSEKTKDSVQGIFSGIDWGELTSTQQRSLTSGFDELGKAIEDGSFKLEKWQKVWKDANTNFQASGDLEKYKKDLSGLAEELEKVTGVDAGIWLEGLTQQFTGLDYASKKLNDFLSTYNLTIADLQNNNGLAISLQQQFQDVNSLLDNFTSSGEINIDLLAKINNGELLTNLPQQINDVIGAVMNDGKLTEQERTLLLNLTTSIANGNEIPNETYEQLEKIFNGEEFEITKPINLGGGIEFSQQDLIALQQYFQEQDLEINVSTNDESINLLKEKVKGLKEYENIKLSVNVERQDSFDSFTTKLDQLPVKKDVKLEILKDVAESNLDGLLKSIESLPPNVQLAILANATPALGKLNEVDKKKLQEKTVQLKAKDNATQKVNTVDNHKKDMNKTVNINAKDNASSVIKKIDLSPVVKKVKIVAEKVGDFFTGGSKKKKSGKRSIEPIPQINNSEANEIQPINEHLSESPINKTPSDNPTTDTSQQISPRYSNNFGGILTVPSLSTKLPSSYGTMLNMLKHGINIFQELENRIDKVNNQIKLLDLQMENSVGTKKIKDLQIQNELYAQQCKLQKNLFDVLENQRRAMQGKAPSFGFSIDGHGNLTNYEETLNRLESAYENAKKKESEYKGEDEATKNRLSKATEEANKQLSEAKEFSSEYLDLFYNKIPGAEQEWQKLQNSIKENNDEIEKLNRENRLYRLENSIKNLNNQMDIWSDKIDLIDVKLDYAHGVDKVNLMKDKISALNEQLKLQEGIINSLNSQKGVYQQDLSNYGAKFDKEGNITNIDDVLNKYQNSSDLEKVTELIDEYTEKIRDDLPDAQKEYEKLNNTIKDVYQDQLEITKDVEDKITEIYKKQIEDKIKAIEKQRDAELKVLDEKKKAYQSYRDEINYKDDYDEQMDKINKLQKQLENAQRDDSLGGRKKVEELLEQLEEENKRLQEIVQDKIDKDINDTFDKENDRIEDKADKEIEDLESKWTDSKIAELVAQALGSGVFTSIDGEVSSLKDTMLEFTNESGEALGVLGSQIQKELCDKLVVVQDVMNNLPNIFDKLNLKDPSARSINMESEGRMRNITIGDTNINISGNANDDVVNKIKDIVKAENEKLIKELYDRS